jgi:hypothetical protein
MEEGCQLGTSLGERCHGEPPARRGGSPVGYALPKGGRELAGTPSRWEREIAAAAREAAAGGLSRL